MLRMSPAGITVSRVCLLTVSTLGLHFTQQILLSAENFNISLIPESHSVVKGTLNLNDESCAIARRLSNSMKSFVFLLLEMYCSMVINVIVRRVSNKTYGH